ncbi:MAG: hypothetical protein SFZ24_02885 [Planctomycetota bacterium]|nr:hypothetical protein [Planctomycetota bacterium]
MHSLLASLSFGRGPVSKAVAAAGGLVVLFVAASLVGPGGSSATPLAFPASSGDERVERLRSVAMPAYMGSLTSGRYTLDVYMDRGGPRYTVRDASGAVLGERLTAEALYERFPELDPSGMHAAPGTPLGEAAVGSDE